MERAELGRGRWLEVAAARSYQRAVAAGCPRSITSAGRTHEEQKVLFERWLRNGKRRPPSVAVPGTSLHESGRALDLPGTARAWMLENGVHFGWVKHLVAKEPWHFEYQVDRDPSFDISALSRTEEDDMPTAKEIAEETVKQLLAHRVLHSPGQSAATHRESASVERLLGDASAGGFRAWKDLPVLRAELAATRAALVTLAQAKGTDPAKIERAVQRAVSKAVAEVFSLED